MKKQLKNKKKKDVIHVCVEVEFMQFQSREAKLEAYRTHAKLFLRAKERMLRADKRRKKY